MRIGLVSDHKGTALGALRRRDCWCNGLRNGVMRDDTKTETPLKIGIFCIDYPTLNAAVSLERAFRERGHKCTLILAQYRRIGDLKARLPSRVASTPFIHAKRALMRLERLRQSVGHAPPPMPPSSALADLRTRLADNARQLYLTARRRLARFAGMVTRPLRVVRRRLARFAGMVMRPFRAARRRLARFAGMVMRPFRAARRRLARFAGMVMRPFRAARRRLAHLSMFVADRWKKGERQRFALLDDMPLSLLFEQAKWHYFARWREMRRAENIIRHHAFDVIIMTEDIEGSITTPFMRAARRLSVPVFLYPHDHSDPDVTFDYFRSDPERQVNTVLRRLVARLLPRHVHEKDGTRLFYSPFPFIIADTINRMSLRRPWLPYSSRNSGILLASENLKQIFLEQGYPKAELHVTGTPDHDVIHAVRKNRKERVEDIIPQGIFEKNRKIILISIGGDAFSDTSHGNRPIFNSWDDFSEFMNEAVSIMEEKYNVIISFHPRVPEKKARKIGSKSTWKTDRYILEILGCSDILITYNGSTVIKYAIAARVPVIIFDAHGYDYDYYAHAPGVRLFSDKQEFMRFVKALVKADTPSPSLLPRGRPEDCRRYGIVDGRAICRMEKVIRQHMHRRKWGISW